MNLENRLSKLRKEKNMMQEELANLLYVTSWETDILNVVFSVRVF